ncbi:hypothetical protein EJ08DRAFT_676502 [Tothia fuscella]|uniref:Integral membrane protein S linking to the trans Golgi network-domain-containing protein n=1 Tax=Tothia fuscella TaxID=1048955 RepID=A0A9P4NWM0_9PEZI|nr:hypothetical protein EJ08DRAFT_676502 [Tothia fuscella]
MPRKRLRRPGALADLQPLRITTQIALLQVAYYVSAAVLIVFTALVAGKEVKLDLLFSWRSLRGDTTVGWMLGLVWLLNSLITVIAVLLLVARSKLVLDFAVTVHFLHLIVTSLYTHSIPSTWFWWALQTASTALLAFLGMWACQWRELRPISFGGHGRSTTSANTAGASEEGTAEESGHSRGRGRGSGRDGAGTYELVGIPENEEV